jgi:TrmH family RNA methyltransferase
MQTIASRQNPIVRSFRDLADRPDAAGTRLLLDGVHLVREAMNAGLAFERVCVAADHLDRDSEAAVLATALERKGADVVAMADKLFAAVSPVRTPSGIVAIAALPHQRPTIDEIVRGPSAMMLVAVDVQDPGNVGALLRVAEAAGASGAVVAGDSANPFSWKALRGSMGSGLRLPVIRADSSLDTIDFLRTHHVRTVAAVARGGEAPEDIARSGRIAIVVGGEGPGLSDELIARCDERVTIPMAAPVESLNVTVAAAILLYTARRQGHTT